jgi:hypothetical protein
MKRLKKRLTANLGEAVGFGVGSIANDTGL